MQPGNTFWQEKNGDISKGDFMDRLKYSLKVGILALLLFCTLNYLVPMQSNAFSIIIYSAIFAVLLMLLVYIFLGIFKEMTWNKLALAMKKSMGIEFFIAIF